jgi:hypothetical protein
MREQEIFPAMSRQNMFILKKNITYVNSEYLYLQDFI